MKTAAAMMTLTCLLVLALAYVAMPPRATGHRKNAILWQPREWLDMRLPTCPAMAVLVLSAILPFGPNSIAARCPTPAATEPDRTTASKADDVAKSVWAHD